MITPHLLRCSDCRGTSSSCGSASPGGPDTEAFPAAGLLGVSTVAGSVEVAVPWKCRTVLQIGSLSGRLWRASRGGLGPKDLGSWVPPRADEATHVGSKHRKNKATAGRRREELHGGTSAAGPVEAARPPWLLLGSPTPQQSLASPCPSASRRGEKPAVP